VSLRTLILVGSGVALVAFNSICALSAAESLKGSVLGQSGRFPIEASTPTQAPVSNGRRFAKSAAQVTTATSPLDLRRLSMADFGDLDQGR
jgi:hypothetical protein